MTRTTWAAILCGATAWAALASQASAAPPAPPQPVFRGGLPTHSTYQYPYGARNFGGSFSPANRLYSPSRGLYPPLPLDRSRTYPLGGPR
ncbi:MAG TPA: hypothetical protein VHY20_11230 [Pirellulales bacterium]|jgi:hypothetical protein|nr:hypothetical protein [Pirellulales bacterium]